MKKALIFLLLILSVFGCASCKKAENDFADITQKITEAIANTDSTTLSNIINPSEKNTAVRSFCYPDSSILPEHIHDKNYDFYQTEKDGVVLEVHAPHVVIPSIEFEVCAIVRNTTDENMSVFIPYGADNPNTHQEIKVTISDGKNFFTDIDVHGKEFADAERVFTLHSGETYTQTMHFMPGKITSISDGKPDAFFENYPSGEYKGTATFTRANLDGGCLLVERNVSLDFYVNVAGKTSTMIP